MSPGREECLIPLLDRSLDRYVDTLLEAIRIPSVNPAFGGTGEGAVQEYIARRMTETGLTVERRDVLPGRPNVVGSIGRGERAALLLNSHVDTASADASRWRRAPWDAHVADGRIVGLGAVDAKGQVVALLSAIDLVLQLGLPLRCVRLASVMDEEAGGRGTVALMEEGLQADAALVGEATGLEICPASRGAFRLEVEIRGQTAHLGAATEGVSAVEKGAALVTALLRLPEELDAAHLHPLWRDLPVGHVTTATVFEAPNPTGAVPDYCRIVWSVGLVAGEQPEQVADRVRAFIARATAGDAWLREHPPLVRIHPPHIEAAASPVDAPLVQALTRQAGRFGLAEVRVGALSAGTDGRHLENLGGIPSVNFGPGDLRRAHSPDESLPVVDFRRAIAWVAGAILELCAGEGMP